MSSFSISRRRLLAAAAAVPLALGGAAGYRAYAQSAQRVATRRLLEAHATAPGASVWLGEAGREGTFVWMAGDHAAQVASDPLQAVFVRSRRGGVWVRAVENGAVQFDWFGAAGDGRANDHEVLRAAIDFMRANNQAYRALHFREGATHYLGDLTRAEPVRLNFSNIVLDGHGATLKLAENVSGASVFEVGNELYRTGENEALPEGITVRRFAVDFNKNGRHLRFLRLRHPCKRILIEDNRGFQSKLGDATPYAGADCWFVALSVIQGSRQGESVAHPENREARLHDVTIRRNVVRNKMQLTADAGRGVKGLTIVDNEVHDPRANGIAITGVTRVTMLEDVLIARNKIYRAEGRGIYIQSDNIGNTQRNEIGGITHYQSFARNVEIVDNLLEDCVAGIRTGTYVQGFHNLTIDRNIVRSTSTDARAGGIRIQSNQYRWAEDYHGGVEPTVGADAFGSGRVRLARHNLPTGGGVRIAPVEGTGTMPVGVAADVPYFVRAADADSFELYTGIDPVTGVPQGRVTIGGGASGRFRIAFTSIATNVVIGPGNVFVVAGGASMIRDVRGLRFDGQFGGRLRMGSLADVTVGAAFTDSVVLLDQGGTERLVFRGARFTGVRGRGGEAVVQAAFGDTANYDVLFERVTVEPGAASGFFSEKEPTRNRKGRGWAMRDSVIGGGNGRFRAIEAPRANSWALERNRGV